MADLSELAARVEAATGPDRELDARITVALDGLGEWGELRRSGYAIQDFKAPPYTASLDAAMTLVPEGWFINRLNEDIGERRFESTLYRRKPPLNGKEGSGASFALALCAAALRSRSVEL